MVTPFSPESFIPLAREFIASEERGTLVEEYPTVFRDPGVAIRDQLDQASSDTDVLVTTVGAIAGFAPAAGVQQSMTLAEAKVRNIAGWLAMRAAVLRRCKDLCPHARAGLNLTSPQPLVASLTGGYISCRACQERYLLRSMRRGSDENCDLCQQPATLFYEGMVSLNAVAVHGNMCSDCNAWLTE